MHIIYGCYGGTHSSPVAAAIHLGHLSRDTIPTKNELMNLKLFDRQDFNSHGSLTCLGTDRWNNKVYVIGRGSAGATVERAVISGLNLAGYNTQEVKFVDTLTKVNLFMRIGGYLSRALGLTGIGRPIVIYGTQRAFFNLVKLVEKVEDNLKNGWHNQMGVIKEKL